MAMVCPKIENVALNPQPRNPPPPPSRASTRGSGSLANKCSSAVKAAKLTSMAVIRTQPSRRTIPNLGSRTITPLAIIISAMPYAPYPKICRKP